jgi:hypothetical protein
VPQFWWGNALWNVHKEAQEIRLSVTLGWSLEN